MPVLPVLPVLSDEPLSAAPSVSDANHPQQTERLNHTAAMAQQASLRKQARQGARTTEAKDAELEALRERVAALEAQIALLKRITVSVNGSLVPVSDLPSVLHLDALHTQVEQATITVAMMGAETVPLVQPLQREASTTAGPAPKTATSAAQTPDAPELLYSEKKLLARLVAQVKALSHSEKAILVWLVEHDGKQVSSQQLADAVGMDRRVTWRDRTKGLLKLPFIQQWGTHQFWYRARFSEYCRRYFSSQAANVQTIESELIHAAR